MLNNAIKSQLNPNKIVLNLSIFFIIISVTRYSSFAADKPKQEPIEKTTTIDAIKDTIEEFYYAVSANHCEDAIELRLNYKIKNCQKIDKVYLHQVEVKANSNKNAVVMIETDVESKQRNSYFKGYLQLQKIQNKWKIIGPYKNMHDYNLTTYINKFLPKGFPHKTNLYKQSTPKKQTATSLRALPPSDVVDISLTRHMSKNKSAITKVDQAPVTLSKQDQEILTYLQGKVAINGNLLLILQNIRDLFPKRASNVILIDQSQGLLYLYNPANELIGYYPLMTSATSQVPKGLYKIHEKELKKGDASEIKSPSNKQSLTMEKMVFSVENEILMSGRYYLREIFDTDQTNSLTLSPMDINKLHVLIGIETLIYIGR